MKKMMIAAVAAMTMVAMSGCGGSGGSGGTTNPGTTQPAPAPEPVPEPLPTSYNVIEDLEFMNIDMDYTWQYTGTVMNQVMKFKDEYNPYGSYHNQLMDDTSTSYDMKACSEAPSNAGFTYLCLGLYSSGEARAFGISISSSGRITGLYEFSITGDAEELAYGLMDSSEADAIVSGYTSRNTATTKTKTTSGNTASLDAGSLDSKLMATDMDSMENQPIAVGNPVAEVLNGLKNQLMDRQ